MTSTGYHYPDPVLARKTRKSLLALFTIGCFLTLPAGLVFLAAGFAFENGLGNMSEKDAVMVLTAVIPSTFGILAWAALGLLLTKPAYPKWHRVAWSLLLLFAISAVPACLYWIIGVGTDGEITIIVLFILVAAVCSMPVATRNLRLARASLHRTPTEQAML